MSLVDDARIILGDAQPEVYSANLGYWSTDKIVLALNEVVTDLWLQSHPQKIKTELLLTVGADVVSIPPTIMIPASIEGLSGEYLPTHQWELERYSKFWRKNTVENSGEPKFFVLWDLRHLRVWPRPDLEYGFDMWGVPWPITITSATETTGYDHDFEHALVWGACALLAESTMPTAADMFEKESREHWNRFGVKMRRQGGEVMSRLTPGTRYQRAQSGVIRIGRREI